MNALGFLLGDKKAGPFKLEIESIKVERAGNRADKWLSGISQKDDTCDESTTGY